MRPRIFVFVIALMASVASNAGAQYISLAIRVGGDLSRTHEIVSGEQFTVLTFLDTGGLDTNAAEWVQTEPQLTIPTLLRTSSVSPNPIGDSLGLERLGEYLLAFGGCYPASAEFQVMAVGYLELGEWPGSDLVLSIRGFAAGDSRPSSFNGSPGFVDCNSHKVACEMYGGQAWETGAGVLVPSGAVVLNPTPPVTVDATSNSFSRMKAEYR